LTLLQPFSAAAGTITFSDLSETGPVGVITDTVGTASRIFILGCGPEFCDLELRSPAAGFFDFNPPQVVYIKEEAPSDLVSDYVFIMPRFDVVEILFQSDNDNGNLGTCSSVGGCSIIEDGSVQTALTVTWQNGVTTATDTIKFESDVVPEPPLAGLTLIALVLLSLSRQSRQGSAMRRFIAANPTIVSIRQRN
jgi:hypothetical protein